MPPKADSASTSLKLYEEGVAGAIEVPCPSANEAALEIVRHNSAAKHACAIRCRRTIIALSPIVKSSWLLLPFGEFLANWIHDFVSISKRIDSNSVKRLSQGDHVSWEAKGVGFGAG